MQGSIAGSVGGVNVAEGTGLAIPSFAIKIRDKPRELSHTGAETSSQK
jgi:hypothetical protein